jgi:hypothetical protein
MKARIEVALLVLALAMACLAGCSTAGGEAALNTSAPAEATPLGSVTAGRVGNTVIVEVALAGIPPKERILALGLKLADGTAVAPSEIHVLRGPSGDMKGSPVVHFDFDGVTAAAGISAPTLCFQARFDLGEAGQAAEDMVFSLALGSPSAVAGNRMGITMAVDTRDGSPFWVDCGAVSAPVAAGEMPMPLEICRSFQAVGFHLESTGGACGDGSVLALAPRAESRDSAGGGPTPVAARPRLAE